MTLSMVRTLVWRKALISFSTRITPAPTPPLTAALARIDEIVGISKPVLDAFHVSEVALGEVTLPSEAVNIEGSTSRSGMLGWSTVRWDVRRSSMRRRTALQQMIPVSHQLYMYLKGIDKVLRLSRSSTDFMLSRPITIRHRPCSPRNFFPAISKRSWQ